MRERKMEGAQTGPFVVAGPRLWYLNQTQSSSHRLGCPGTQTLSPSFSLSLSLSAPSPCNFLSFSLDPCGWNMVGAGEKRVFPCVRGIYEEGGLRLRSRHNSIQFLGVCERARYVRNSLSSKLTFTRGSSTIFILYLFISLLRLRASKTNTIPKKKNCHSEPIHERIFSEQNSLFYFKTIVFFFHRHPKCVTVKVKKRVSRDSAFRKTM